jgi:hypothetical protein
MRVEPRLDHRHGLVFDGSPLPSGLLHRARGYLSGKGSCTQTRIVQLAVRQQARGRPSFVVRVDDFPRWDRGLDGFLRFDEILSAAAVPYVLGVIPAPCRDPEATADDDERRLSDAEAQLLVDIRSHVEFALHGWSHRRRPGPIASEVVGTGAELLAERLDVGISRLQALGLAVESFIPPYNAIDRRSMAMIGRRLPVVFGGPESVRWLGCVPGPARLEDVWYLPSYPPAYGRAGELAALVRRIRDRDLPLLVPLTLHWAWEQDDGFAALRELAGLLTGAAVPLGGWLHGPGSDRADPGAAGGRPETAAPERRR